MKDGIYIRPAIVRLVTLVLLVGLAKFVKGEIPAAKRYLKSETM